MSKQTDNYDLVKPDYSDKADIMVLNGNFDLIDAKLKELEDRLLQVESAGSEEE